MCSPDLQHCYGGIKERECHRCRSSGASHHLRAVCRWWHHGRLAHRTTTRVVNFWSGQFWSDDSTIFTSYNVSQSSCIRDAISSWWPTRHNWCWYAVCVWCQAGGVGGVGAAETDGHWSRWVGGAAVDKVCSRETVAAADMTLPRITTHDTLILTLYLTQIYYQFVNWAHDLWQSESVHFKWAVRSMIYTWMRI